MTEWVRAGDKYDKENEKGQEASNPPWGWQPVERVFTIPVWFLMSEGFGGKYHEGSENDLC
jgi:hypothetical protein